MPTVRDITSLRAAMAKDTKTDQLKRRERVVSLVDLRQVPRGTPGRVTMVSGLSWIRYFVDFDGGVSVASLDRSQLATPSEWREWKDRPAGAEVAEAAEPAAETAAADAGESVGGIPAHLLERSRQARERLAAKAG
ncbi:MAG: hypothetical protein AVDCRST_MAG76-2308 [uncultured Acidimicrobiales bacterium]|uniref:Uncharacterized protein n=1 Tax=uncultured Acidimicrobiales bacterium TaxID=310071 RepID=A0A6J4IFX7_9ACTN|nr:MAG: hypothetical protein AVDCRST_MAG76-2308 [uncultured Acidimicrobiales bacterium]